MLKQLGGLAVVGLLLVGCAPTAKGTAEKCGGTNAGVHAEHGAVRYAQQNDSTGAAWTCVLGELVPDKADQYAITQDMAPGETGTFFTEDFNIAYGVDDDGAVMIVAVPAD